MIEHWPESFTLVITGSDPTRVEIPRLGPAVCEARRLAASERTQVIVHTDTDVIVGTALPPSGDWAGEDPERWMPAHDAKVRTRTAA